MNKDNLLRFLKQHGIALLFSLIVLLSLTVSYLFIENYEQRKNGFYSAIKEVFQNVKEKYKGEFSENSKLSVWWISEDGLNISNDNSTGIKFNSFNCESENFLNSNSNFKEMAQLIGSEIDEIMAQNGFKLNRRNSSKSIEDNQFYDYVRAYEKESVKATFTANPDCSTGSSEKRMHHTFSFGFTDEFDKNYQEQSLYLKDLGISKAIIRVQKNVGDFVFLNVHLRRTVYYIIAKQIDSKWKELFSGQEIISCEIIKRYEIPKEIISNCY